MQMVRMTLSFQLKTAHSLQDLKLELSLVVKYVKNLRLMIPISRCD